MHAFDREQLVGAVDVRMARNGEELVLLDGKTDLTEDVLVIADQEAPLALAGIMGVGGPEFRENNNRLP